MYKPCVKERSTESLISAIKEEWNVIKNLDFSEEFSDEQADSFENILAFGQCIIDRGLSLQKLDYTAYKAYSYCSENC